MTERVDAEALAGEIAGYGSFSRWELCVRALGAERDQLKKSLDEERTDRVRQVRNLENQVAAQTRGLQVKWKKNPTGAYVAAVEKEVHSLRRTSSKLRAERDGLEDLDNIMLESLYFPLEDLILGARADIIKEDGSDDALALSLMARYNILINVFAQVELRTLKDDDLISGGTNEEETKGRLFLVVLF